MAAVSSTHFTSGHRGVASPSPHRQPGAQPPQQHLNISSGGGVPPPTHGGHNVSSTSMLQSEDWINIPKIVREKLLELQEQMIPLQRKAVGSQNFEVEVRRWVEHCGLLTEASDNHRGRLEILEQKLERSEQREERLRHQLAEDHQGYLRTVDELKTRLDSVMRATEEASATATEARRLTHDNTSRGLETSQSVLQMAREAEDRHVELRAKVEDLSSTSATLRDSLVGSQPGARGPLESAGVAPHSILGRLQRIEHESIGQKREVSAILKETTATLDSGLLAVSNRVSLLSQDIDEKVLPKHEELTNQVAATQEQVQVVGKYVGLPSATMGGETVPSAAFPMITSTIATSAPICPPGLAGVSPHPSLQLMQGTRSVSPSSTAERDAGADVPPIFSSQNFQDHVKQAVTVHSNIAVAAQTEKMTELLTDRHETNSALLERQMEQVVKQQVTSMLQDRVNPLRDSVEELKSFLGLAGATSEADSTTLTGIIYTCLAEGLKTRDTALDELAAMAATLQDRLHALAHHSKVVMDSHNRSQLVLEDVIRFVDPFDMMKPQGAPTAPSGGPSQDALHASFEEVDPEDSASGPQQQPEHASTDLVAKTNAPPSTRSPLLPQQQHEPPTHIGSVIQRIVGREVALEAKKGVLGPVGALRRDLEIAEKTLRAEITTVREENECLMSTSSENIERSMRGIRSTLAEANSDNSDRKERQQVLAAAIQQKKDLSDLEDRLSNEIHQVKVLVAERVQSAIDGLEFEHHKSDVASRMNTMKQQLRSEMVEASSPVAESQKKNDRQLRELHTQLEDVRNAQEQANLPLALQKERAQLLTQHLPPVVESLVNDQIALVKRGLKQDLSAECLSNVEDQVKHASAQSSSTLRQWAIEHVDDQIQQVSSALSRQQSQRCSQVEDTAIERVEDLEQKFHSTLASTVAASLQSAITPIEQGLLLEKRDRIQGFAKEREERLATTAQHVEHSTANLESVIAEQVIKLHDEMVEKEDATTKKYQLLLQESEDSILTEVAKFVQKNEDAIDSKIAAATKVQELEAHERSLVEGATAVQDVERKLGAEMAELHDILGKLEGQVSEHYASSVQDCHLALHSVRGQLNVVCDVLGLTDVDLARGDADTPESPARSRPLHPALHAAVSQSLVSLLGGDSLAAQRSPSLDGVAADSEPAATAPQALLRLLVRSSVLDEIQRQVEEADARNSAASHRADGAEVLIHEPGSALLRLQRGHPQNPDFAPPDGGGGGAFSTQQLQRFDALVDDMTTVKASVATCKTTVDDAALDIRRRTEELDTRFLDVREEWLGFKRDQLKQTYSKPELDEKLLVKVDVSVFNNRLAAKFNRDDVDELRKIIGSDLAEMLVEVHGKLEELDYLVQERVTRSQLNDYLRDRTHRAARAGIGALTPGGGTTPRTDDGNF